MSSIKLSPNASGTGEFTIAAPNSNTNRTLTLPDQTGTILTNAGPYTASSSATAGAVTIDASNNVGIGTSSPATRLHVAKAGSNYVVVENTSTSVSTYFGSETGNGIALTTTNHPLVFGTNNTERARILTTGQFNPGADNSYGFGGSGIRWAVIWAANGTIQTSDARQKNSITNSDLGLSFIGKLRPVSYKWNVGQNIVSKDENGNDVITPRPGVRTHYGLIAQEVKEALGDKDFGGFIHDENTDEMGLRYDQFIAPLIKAIQEQQALINDLTTAVADLKTELAALKGAQA